LVDETGQARFARVSIGGGHGVVRFDGGERRRGKAAPSV
jgi:hypothetical protein